MMISEIYKKFLVEQKFRNNTKKTIDWYKDNLEEFFEWLGGSDDEKLLTLDNFKLYGAQLRDSVKRNGDKLSDASVQNALRAVKTFYNYCIENGYIEDFSKYLKLPKAHFKVQEILDNEEINTLLSCFSETKTGMRNKCMVVLMLDSGLRRGELLRLNVGDVHLKLGKPSLIVKGKGGKQRIVPMGMTSTSLLNDYVNLYRKNAGLNEPLFISENNGRCTDNLIKQMFKRLKKQSEMPRLHPHLLRHTFATYYIADGGDLETLRLILGHANIQTTQRYLHMAATLALQTSRHTSHLDKIYQ